VFVGKRQGSKWSAVCGGVGVGWLHHQLSPEPRGKYLTGGIKFKSGLGPGRSRGHTQPLHGRERQSKTGVWLCGVRSVASS
jgi:hypothetical protein